MPPGLQQDLTLLHWRSACSSDGHLMRGLSTSARLFDFTMSYSLHNELERVQLPVRVFVTLQLSGMRGDELSVDAL